MLLPSDDGPSYDILPKLHLWKLSGVHSASSPENFQLLSLAASTAAFSPTTSPLGVDGFLFDSINEPIPQLSCWEDAEIL